MMINVLVLALTTLNRLLEYVNFMGRELSLVAEVAKRLGVKLEVLEKDALRLWLKHRLRSVEAEIASILGRYEVKSLEELEARIKSGSIPEHPAWEDLIVLENLEEERKRIIEVLREIEKQSD